MNPVIGIVPLIDVKLNSYWMLPEYMDSIRLAGGLPVMLPPTEEAENIADIAAFCNGFLFAGGNDIQPSFYGEEKLPECGASLPIRDTMETMLLKEVLKTDKPVLGICRGMQLMNVVLGGTLYQDIFTQMTTDLPHRQKPPYDVPVHTVTAEKETPLHALLGKDTLEVNSRHHQAVKELAPALSPMAYAPDGIIEAVHMSEKPFVWAVQWHPEHSHLSSPDSVEIFRAFVDACR